VRRRRGIGPDDVIKASASPPAVFVEEIMSDGARPSSTDGQNRRGPVVRYQRPFDSD